MPIEDAEGVSATCFGRADSSSSVRLDSAGFRFLSSEDFSFSL
jgi:hypothetical protein